MTPHFSLPLLSSLYYFTISSLSAIHEHFLNTLLNIYWWQFSKKKDTRDVSFIRYISTNDFTIAFMCCETVEKQLCLICSELHSYAWHQCNAASQGPQN